MSRETIAKALKRLREQSCLTADQVGALVGKSGKTINAWENNRGQPDADMLLKLCDIYKVDNILAEFKETTEEALNLTLEEKEIIVAYRERPDIQNAVKILLGLKESRPMLKKVKIAARSGVPIEERPLTDSEIELFTNGKEWHGDDEL